jgi:hypothetical protein
MATICQQSLGVKLDEKAQTIRIGRVYFLVLRSPSGGLYKSEEIPAV